MSFRGPWRGQFEKGLHGGGEEFFQNVVKKWIKTFQNVVKKWIKISVKLLVVQRPCSAWLLESLPDPQVTSLSHPVSNSNQFSEAVEFRQFESS